MRDVSEQRRMPNPPTHATLDTDLAETSDSSSALRLMKEPWVGALHCLRYNETEGVGPRCGTGVLDSS